MNAIPVLKTPSPINDAVALNDGISVGKLLSADGAKIIAVMVIATALIATPSPFGIPFKIIAMAVE
jgi:hypothetical protein